MLGIPIEFLVDSGAFNRSAGPDGVNDTQVQNICKVRFSYTNLDLVRINQHDNYITIMCSIGAITSFAAGYVKIRWSLWSELVIGSITAAQAGLLLLMGLTGNIWVCYVAYALFRGFYQFLVPIAM